MEATVTEEITQEKIFELADELKNPKLEGWEFFVETMGIKIYRKYFETSGLYEYKVYGVFEGVDPQLCVNVYMDLDYRKKWDGYVYELYEINDGQNNGIYWQVKYPFPMSNRDYAYVRHLQEIDHEGKHLYIAICYSKPFECAPEKNGVLRVDDYKQFIVFTSDDKGGTQMYMFYYDNPKGNIPTWLINWAAKTGVPGFLKNMKKACDEYSKYKESHS